jgi:hypothetical protein
MSVSIEARWTAAQVGERRFHCDDVEGWGANTSALARRVQEARMRHWYAGMLGIPVEVDPAHSVTDFACGPESLLLRHPQAGPMVAVDPLTFLPDDEARYREAGITRVVAPMERYEGAQTDEVWLYNCLQHVIDWESALRVACRTARQYVRLFEWVGVPTDALHLHTLAEEELSRVLRSEGFRELRAIRGERVAAPYTPTAFVAAVWGRVP